MDSFTGSEDLERLKERMKLNFFQIEKRLAEDDIRLDSFEKEIKSFKNLQKAAEKAGKDQAFLESVEKAVREMVYEIRGIKEENAHMRSDYEKLRKLDKTFEEYAKNHQTDMEKIFSRLSEKKGASALGPSDEKTALYVSSLGNSVSSVKGELEELKSEFKKFGASQAGKAEKGMVAKGEMDKEIARLDKSVISLRDELDKNLGKLVEIEKDIREAAKQKRKGDEGEASLPADFEEKVAEVKKDLAEIAALREELGRDKMMYREIRVAVIASLERLGGMEKQLSRGLEEMAEIRKETESLRNMNDDLIKQNRSEIARLEFRGEDMKRILETALKELRIEFKGHISEIGGSVEKLDSSIDSALKDEVGRLEVEIENIKRTLESGAGSSFKHEVADIGSQMSLLRDEVSGLKLGHDEVLKSKHSHDGEKQEKAEVVVKEHIGSLQQEISKREERLENKMVGLEKSFSDFKTGLPKEIDEKFGVFKDDFGSYLDHNFEKNSQKIDYFRSEADKLKVEISNLKKGAIDKAIDEEMNKLLIILNEKLKGLVTINDFEQIRSDIRLRLEQVRSPEIRPLEAKIVCLEDDVAEMKRLLRGISQRLPVIVE